MKFACALSLILLVAPAAFASKHRVQTRPQPAMPSAQQNDATDAYALALRNIVDPCRELSFKLWLKDKYTEGPPEDPSAIEADIKPWRDCMDDVRSKGAAVYQNFVTSGVSAQLKDDGKQVFAAWLAYLDTLNAMQETLPQNNEATALREIEGTMKADALGARP